MTNENNDVKPGEESSTPSDATASQDVKPTTEEASTSGEASSAQTQEQTLGDVVEKAAQDSLAREKDAAGAALDLSSTEEQEPPPGDMAAEAEVDTTKDEDVPKEFAKHPAWQRIMGERNAAREQATKLEATAKSQEGLYTYLRQHSITDVQFREALEVVSLLNADPAKAYEKLRPIVEQLELHTGKRLPEDLQKKVTEGLLDPETAAEVARFRAEKQFGARKGETDAVQRQQAVVSQMVSSLDAWDKSKAGTDADFDKKSVLIRSTFLSLYEAKDAQGRSLNPVHTPQDAVALAERAYKEVNESIAKFQPAGPARRVLTSRNASSTNHKTAPRNTQEAVAAMLREKHGIEFDNGE